jgi:hypothetical protein
MSSSLVIFLSAEARRQRTYQSDPNTVSVGFEESNSAPF